MAIRIGDEAPDFTAQSTQGPIKFHEWIGDGWAILFSHPKDFTPVCTTELGYMAGLAPEFKKRNYKIVGLSVDPVDDHQRWLKDIEETQGHAVTYPLIGDRDLTVAKLYDMIHPNASATQPRTAADNSTIRSVFLIGPGQEGEGGPHLPDEHGPELRRGAAAARLDSAHRGAQGRDARQLEARRGRDHRPVGVGRGSEAALSAGLARAEALHAVRSRAEVEGPSPQA